MTRLVSAELLKLRTTWLLWGFGLAMLGLVALTVVTLVASSETEFTGEEEALDAVQNAGTSIFFVLLLGALSFTTEFRHGTITETFLVTPVRERVLLAKALAYALVGVALAALAAALALAIAVPWFSAKGVDLELADRDVVATVAGTLGAAALWGVVGVGIGAIVRNQIGAIVGLLVWTLVAEPLLGTAIPSGWEKYLPGAASSAMIGDFIEDPLSRIGGAAVTAAYAVASLALAAVALGRRDVS